MKLLLLGLSLGLFISCGADSQKTDLDFYPVKEENFQKYINQKSIGSGADLAQDIHIVNNDYPIEISLYKDGTWYYNLPNLDDGKGTWKYVNGRIELFAERPLFDMHIDIVGTTQNATNLVIKFSDRHGPRTLKVENRNLN